MSLIRIKDGRAYAGVSGLTEQVACRRISN